MFQDLEDMIQKVTTGEIDPGSVGASATEHVGAMSQDQVEQQVKSAVDNANQNGNPDIAQELLQLFVRHSSDPRGFKSALIALIESNPQLLAHFAPEFAQRILRGA